MNNVSCLVWRIPCPGSRAWTSLQPNQATFRPAVRNLRIPPPRPFSVYNRCLTSRGPLLGLSYPAVRRLSPCLPPFRSFNTSGCVRAQNEPPVEHGVPLRDQSFSAAEINKIFGRGGIPPEMGNRALAVLQGRRVAGTLDLELPADIIGSVNLRNLETALEWLRTNYPLDEDAAIIARIHREEREEEAKLIRRATELGLYKPQSGSYDAELGEKGDVSGKSVLKETRKQNEARNKEMEEQRRREWLEGEAQEREKLQRLATKSTAMQQAAEAGVVEARPRADPKERPLLAWMQKHHLRATDMDIDASSLNTPRRLLPSLGLVILVIGGCYAYAQNYEAPKRKDRLWPTIPPAGATVLGLIGVNLGVYVLWKIPPAWRMLNRYFLVVPMYPRALSMVGSMFSHQSLKHLGVNSAVLFVLGTRIHDDIGRGNFLGIYLGSGVLASLSSLLVHVLAGRLHLSSLGASGAVCGIVGAMCIIRSNDRFSFFFLPPEWQEKVSAKGSAVLAALIAFEVLSLVSPWRVLKVDNWAHLGGYLAGSVSGFALKSKLDEERRKNSSWWRNFLNGEQR